MPFAEARKPLLAVAFASLAALARAVPDLYFPINSQVPPVAYVSQQYAFTFSATTFVSNKSQLSYIIADGPDWLQLDTSSRSFTGTPAQSDVGANIVQLNASDSTGEYSDSITLIVLESTQLGTGTPVLPQLQQAGLSSSAPDSLLLRPLQPFEVIFDLGTFTGIGSKTTYYAISDDRSPLPPWVQFEQLSFSGTGPPLVSLTAPPQTYGFFLIASDVVGFEEATVHFDIVVGYNVFAFENVSQTVGISSGLPFQTPPLRSQLTLNGNVCADGQIASIVTDGPEWVELDRSRISLSGTPQTAINTIVTISVTDVYNDVANTTVLLQANSVPAVSLGTIGDVNVTLGENFSYTLNNPAFADSGSISADLGSANGWLHFDSSSGTLSGQPPMSLPEDIIPVTIAFANATAKLTATVVLYLMPDKPPNGMATASNMQTRALPQASETSNPQNSSPSSGNTSKWSSTRMILAIVLSVLAVLIIICLILLWTLRKRRKRSTNAEFANLESVQPTTTDGSPGVSPSRARPLTAPSRPLTRPPRIDLSWPNDSIAQSRYKLSGIAVSEDDRTSKMSLGEGSASRQSYINRKAQTRHSGTLNQRSAENENCAQEQARVSRIGQSGTVFSTTNRASAVLDDSSTPQAAVGLPDRRSGAGHGSGILLRSDSEAAGRSWRDTWTSKPVRDSKRSTVMLESFPNPPISPGSKRDRAVLRARSTTPSMRDSVGSLSFEARRQKWHTERARARLEGSARFSNAGTSRMMPSPRDHWTGRSRGDVHSTALSTIPDAGRLKYGPASRQHTWSDWSGVGPAAHGSLKAGSPLDSALESFPNTRTNISLASSGQFESVTSSDSWEDEGVIVKETADGARQWEADENSRNSPRLPFESESKENENSVGYARHARVSDARKRHTSVGEGGLTRSKASHHGSFRFI